MEHIGVSESFGYRRFLCIRRGHHYFPLNFFLSHTTKKIVGEPFCVSKRLCYRLEVGGEYYFWFEKKKNLPQFSKSQNKNYLGKCCNLSPYLAIQNPVVPSTRPEEQLRILTNVSEIIKIFGTTETRTPDLLLENLAVLTLLLTFIFEKKVGNFGLKKMTQLNEYFFLHIIYAAENNNKKILPNNKKCFFFALFNVSFKSFSLLEKICAKSAYFFLRSSPNQNQNCTLI